MIEMTPELLDHLTADERAAWDYARLELPAALLALAQTKQALEHMAKIAGERHNQIADLETELAQLRAAVDAAPCPDDCSSVMNADEGFHESWKTCDCWKSRLPK